MIVARRLVASALLLAAACTPAPGERERRTSNDPDDAGPDDVDDAGPDDEPDAGPGEDACPDDICPTACAAPIGGACIPAGTEIEVDTPFSVRVLTTACLSSSCTGTVDPICDVTIVDDVVTLRGASCFFDSSLPGEGCSEDCGGADNVPCEIPGLPAGSWTLDFDDSGAGGEQLNFQVPTTIADDSEPCAFPG